MCALVSERPLLCVASHTHFDHIGCHHEFPDRCVHRAEAEILADPRNDWTLADRYATDDMFDRLPEGWDASTLPDTARPGPAPARRTATSSISATAHFEVIHTPGHSPGGIGLFEQASGIFLSGDIVYDGPLIDDAYHSDREDYVGNDGESARPARRQSSMAAISQASAQPAIASSSTNISPANATLAAIWDIP